MRIGEFVLPELVLVGLRSTDLRAVLNEIVAPLPAGSQLRAEAEQSLWEREVAHTTALEAGIAVPHATLPGLERPVAGIATSATPLSFGSAPVPVRVLFLLLSPPEQGQLHIKLLARIARLARRPGFVERLVAAPTPSELLLVLEQEELKA